ncbi:MAG: hypothetical protein IKN00_04355 [Bacteroidales bacterium]|nr:hypothetical protein [Bacteroidales bacterium]
MTEKLKALKARLNTYPGAHTGEDWKKDTDLTHCTERERAEMARCGVTVEELEREGFDRGQVAHMLFGYRHTGRRS